MPRQANEVLDSLTLTDNKCHFNRVRENEALISSAALSIVYSGVFHSYINALTLFLHCVNQCQLCGAYILLCPLQDRNRFIGDTEC